MQKSAVGQRAADETACQISADGGVRCERGARRRIEGHWWRGQLEAVTSFKSEKR